MVDKIATINNELQQIYVRGVDTVHMATALTLLEQVYSELINSTKEKADEVSDSK